MPYAKGSRSKTKSGGMKGKKKKSKKGKKKK